MKHFFLFFNAFFFCDRWKHIVSLGESGTVVLHLTFVDPFSSARLAVVIRGEEENKWMGVIRSGLVGTGKHEDILD